MRSGIGFDVHPFDPSRPLVLGGVRIAGEPGLSGHSDADVLCHAVADALLGSCALGDLGTHFPDTDPAWLGASSLDILARAMALVRDAGYALSSADATLVLERPRIAPHVEAMRANLARAMAVEQARVSVKATRMEGLGALGRAEGAACLAIVTVSPG